MYYLKLIKKAMRFVFWLEESILYFKKSKIHRTNAGKKKSYKKTVKINVVVGGFSILQQSIIPRKFFLSFEENQNIIKTY